MKRISITKPLFFIDTRNGFVYWFREVTDQEIVGIGFKKSKNVESGTWDRKEWKKVISLSPPQRFKALKNLGTELTEKRKHNIITSVFNEKI